ncbi:unnamed protein product [Rhodiola kirilowii]
MQMCSKERYLVCLWKSDLVVWTWEQKVQRLTCFCCVCDADLRVIIARSEEIAALLHQEFCRRYSCWWDSHISPKKLKIASSESDRYG